MKGALKEQMIILLARKKTRKSSAKTELYVDRRIVSS